MRIFCTNSSSPLIQATEQWLNKIHSVKTVKNFFSIENESKTLMQGTDVFIHSLSEDPDMEDHTKLDEAIRQTYALLSTCVEMGVKRFIFLGTLDTFKTYDPDYIIDEMWKPKPTTEINALTSHMSEFICKEFGREHKIDVRVLRLGEVCWEESSNSDSPLFIVDALQAIQRTVETDLISPDYIRYVPNTWNVFHIQSVVPNMRFKIIKAEDELGFSPQRLDL
ncbi:MAG: NAD(P)-dependent oxidoreductase [SAR202 cluster bacterium]|nr:hypothetical protein [Chloroflexota bacterium]MQG22485.1 NAD(P)-dependent oxidoreductase [SAR202 cluster bacterium]|tara:strand:- start:389 stop:1057 length:669 start_codon:yes stop_codon:yes gene_type:complete